MAMISGLISLFNNTLAIFKSVTGPYVMFGLFMAAVIYILLLREKRERYVLSVMAVLVLFLFFNPVVFWVLGKRLLGDQTYCRMLWTVPQVMMIALAMTDLCCRFDREKLKKAGVVALCVCTLMVSGRIVYNADNFEKRENAYGFSDELVEILQAVQLSDRDGLRTRIAAEPEIAGKVRQLRSDLYPRFDGNGFTLSGGQTVIYLEFKQPKPEVENLVFSSLSGHAYLLLYREHDDPEFVKWGCYLAHETENYVLYCLDDVPRDQWKNKKDNGKK